MKRVIALKEIHDESREQQKKARANLYEIDPDAILPELSGSAPRVCCCSSNHVLSSVAHYLQIPRFGIQVEMTNWNAYSS